MLGVDVSVAGYDVTADVETINIKWPATTAVPTATVVLNNQSGKYAGAFPLWSFPVVIQLPNNVSLNTTTNQNGLCFWLESMQYDFITSLGGGLNTGHKVQLNLTAAPELLYSYDGLISVVGTDLPAPIWNSLASPEYYTPYPSTWVSNLNRNLLDIGSAIYNLLNQQQPSQPSGYVGRANYELGYGINTSTGIYSGSGTSLGFYTKAMWSVGQGSQGNQQTSLDIIRNLITKNVIDGSGNMQILDFYVDISRTVQNSYKPGLFVFQRGSISSGQTFTAGVDAIQELHLPVDTTDVKNFVFYFPPAEVNYPATRDAWSNYPATAFLESQWTLSTIGGIGAGVLTTSTYTPNSQGYSNQYTRTQGSQWDFESDFSLVNAGYASMNSGTKNVSRLNFYFARDSTTTNDGFSWGLRDAAGNQVVYFWGFGSGNPLPSNTNWNQLSAQIPTDGTTISNGGSYNGWICNGGSGWTFGGPAGSTISTIFILNGEQGSGMQSGNWWFDYIYLGDSWNFGQYGAYSYNPYGPGATTLQLNASHGHDIAYVTSIQGFAIGQYATIGLGLSTQETAGPINRIAMVGGHWQLEFSHNNLVHDHSAGEIIIAATHDPISIAAYGPRPFPYQDYYITQADSDSADQICYNLLAQRKGKHSSGTIKVNATTSAQSQAIKPGYTFQINDPKDIYVGNSSVDSAINGWIVDQIEYNLAAMQNEGFTATYTIEPYYSSISGSSPDTNGRNLFRYYISSQQTQINQLYRSTQRFGAQP